MNINLLDSELLKSVIKTCDLLFVTIPENSLKEDLSKDISLSIDNENDICIHVALLKNEINEEIKVIEAETEDGVIYRSLKNFIEMNYKKNPLKKFYIKRIKSTSEEVIIRWINEIEKLIGYKKHSYLTSKDSLYCCELIYNVYKDNKNQPLFTENPMNFKDKEGNFLQYWIEFYKKLNKEIPQGKMGITPHQMMQSKILFNLCEIQKNDNISYSFYNIENDNEIYNETQKALNENNTDIWTQFEKKMKLNPNFEAIGTRKYINGEFKEYDFIKMSDCFSLAEKIGNGLANIGLKENDIVLELMNQRIEVPIINMALWRQGAIIVPKPIGNVDIKEYMLQIQPKLLILTPEYIKSFYEHCKQLYSEKKLNAKQIILLPYPNGPDQDKEVLSEDIINCYKEIEIKIYKYNEIINLGKKIIYERKEINPENIAYILNSSRTSQTNLKSICLSHKNVIASCIINNIYIKNFGEYKLLLSPNFGHASDCILNVCAMLCPNLGLGYTSNGKYNYFEDLRIFRPNATYVIPATLKNLYDEYNLKLKEGISKEKAIEYILKEKLGGNMKYVNCFGSGLSKEITGWCINDLKFKFANYFGATEVIFIFSEVLENSKKQSNYISNKPRYAKIRIKKIEKNDQSFISEFEEENQKYKIIRGELLVKNENVMKGYYKNKELTEKVLDKENYYHTGDIIEYNTKTNDILLVDRLNNIIILQNSVKIPVSSLENSILSNPLFKQCLVYGNENNVKLFCIVVLNKDLLKKDFTNFEEEYEKIYEKVLKEMDNIYKENRFPNLWKYDKIIIEFKEWTLDEGLITISGKVVRRAVIEKYKNKLI